MYHEDAASLSLRTATTRAPDAAAVARRRIGVGALVVFAWLAWSIGLHPLTLPDEGRYVGVAWEMLRSGNWLIPTENGLPFFHKPPLFYWLTALSMHAFGVNAAAARLAALVCACLAVAGVFAVTRRRAGEPIAAATVLVLATMPFFFAASHYANLDMPVAAFIALAIVFAADAALDLDRGAPHRNALLLAWTCAALGVLAKGLIGIVLPGLVIVVWLLASGRWRTIARLLSPLGIALFVLIAAPWFVLVERQHPGFARYFFVHHHFERFVEHGFNNAQPWWFFVAVLPALTLPWSLWLVRMRRSRAGATGAGAASDAQRDDLAAWRRLMWIWLATVVVFFSLPQSKPVGYIMPALFPLAFLVAEPALAAWRSTRAGWRGAVAASAAIAVVVCAGAVAWMATRYQRDNTALAHTLRAVRAPGDPVVFVDEYFFDVPLHARLSAPVPVVSDWNDPAIPNRDNWRRELSEAGAFDRARAATLLVDAEHGFALRCGRAPLWVLVKRQDEAQVAAKADAVRIATSHGASLWRLAPQACASASTTADRRQR
nr:glycosyltransferase family 39 protein [Caldimonas sp.]